VRIAQVSPAWERVPPPAYGGIEAVVSLLTEELVRRGGEVTLYATGDSRTSARLKSVIPRPLRASKVQRPIPIELAHISQVLRDAAQYDVIHNHCGELLMAFSNVVSAPILTTVHGPMAEEATLVWDHYTGYFNTISHAAKNGFPDQRYLGVVYNGIDVESFPFCPEKDDYLLFLGRVSEEKGTHLAIEVARALGSRLVIAGKVDPVDVTYYVEKVKPAVDGAQIVYVGEADANVKRQLYAHARCLLQPVTWPEPFGLVMAEAMACGTAVVGLRRGSIPELIVDRETGFVVDSVEEMIDAVGRVGTIDPYRCRDHVLACFSADQMVRGYEKLYETILGARTE
jgi:glycosyltransferase involved in cell wall biosynthesis